MEITKNLLLLAGLICIATGCVTEKDLQEIKRSDWIKPDPGILAPPELVAPKKEDE